MRVQWLMCVLLGTLAWGQASPGTAPTPPVPTLQDNSAAVAPTAAVITINGVCSPQAKPPGAASASKPGTASKSAAVKTPASDCKTVVTKAEFEKTINNLVPKGTPITAQMRKQLAGYLPQWIAMSSLAKKKGLDKTPEFEERMKITRMQILAREVQQSVQEQAGNVSPEEVEAYYKEHSADYAQYNLERIYVPLRKQAEPQAQLQDENKEKLSEEAQKAKQAEEKAKAEESEKAMTELADSLRTRAAAGEDFIKLQKEAFAAAGMKIDAPTVALNNVRRTGLPPSQAAVFSLKPGEISQVINDAGGHYIYKVNNTSEVPLDQAKNEIHGKLQGERIREAMDKLTNSYKVETNEAYFGPGAPGPGPGPRMPRSPGAPASARPGAPVPQPPGAAAPAPSPKPN